MKPQVFYCITCFVFGLMLGKLFETKEQANLKELGSLYPKALGLVIRKNARVIHALSHANTNTAIDLLLQDIRVTRSSLLGIEKVIQLGEEEREALRISSEFVRPQPN